MENTLFFSTITPPKGSAFVIPIILVVIFVVFMMGIVLTMQHTSIAMTDRELVIKSFPYGKRIPLEKVMAHEIRTLNLNADSEYRIARRTNGTSLPNFLAGWMKLNNGKKALVFITDKNNVVMIPTKDFVLMFSTEKADEFMAKIKGIE